MKKLIRTLLYAAAMFIIAAAFPLSAGASTSERTVEYNRIWHQMKQKYSVVYARQLDLTGDGRTEFVVVLSDGIIRSYDEGAFCSEYTIRVWTYDPASRHARSAGSLTGLFYDAGVGEGIQALAMARRDGRTYLVCGGMDMNYRYNFYELRKGRLTLARQFRCDWKTGICTVNGKSTDRTRFLDELRSWQKDVQYLRYFSGALSTDRQRA